MKQFTYILSFILMLLQFNLFIACSDDDNTVSELKLDRTAIQVKQGSEGILKIESGSGGYQFSFSAEGYAEAKYRDNLIYIQGKNYGKVVLTITDLAGNTAKLDVVIISSVLNTDTQRFVWGNMIELNKANNWGLTVEENSIALTNVLEGKQYVLSCDGDLSVGIKQNATLEILSSKEGEAPQEIILAGMEVLQVKDGLCSIIFSSADTVGELVFQQ
ncbi:hypothetical protein [Bacteroides sp. 224]|uniref:hypothetical protein n=1 Tax=Bacteroides sp. 224 TaxID=2302936 RepID=UPI0013D0F89A|nr:hypothetical protein [Bacteroides sp. 224]NDV63658.1 hypothetical protein [Bacteroides sp. 224]